MFESIKSSCSFRFIKQSSLITVPDSRTGKSVPRNNSKERLELLLGKGVFPYEYANSIEDFDCSKLIEKKYFYNSITRSSITDE